MMSAMLLCAGEWGFRETSVERVCRRCNASPDDFRARFDSTAECFARAYAAEGDRIVWRVRELLDGDGGRRLRVEELLAEATAGLARQPALARALLVEVHAAGPAAVRERWRLGERFAFELDGLAGDGGASRRPCAPQFIVGAVEGALTEALLRGEEAALSTAVPELAELACATLA
jgi:AcrR family transcriptional regulator